MCDEISRVWQFFTYRSSLFTRHLKLKVLQRHDQHSEAFPVFFFGVLVVSEMGTCQALKVAVLDLAAGAPSVVDHHFVHGHVGNAVEQDPQPHIEAEIESGHHPELHVQPTWNSEYEREPVVTLEESVMGLMMVAVNGPTEGVHHILMREPRHEFHEPECGNDPKYVDDDLHFF